MSIDYLNGLLQEVSNEMLQEVSHEEMFDTEGGHMPCWWGWGPPPSGGGGGC